MGDTAPVTHYGKRRSVLTKSGARKLIQPDGEANYAMPGEAPAPKRKPGRPASAPGGATTLAAPLAVWRVLITTLESARDKPRAAETTKLVEEAISYIAGRLGPARDPDYVPAQRPVAVRFRVQQPDGTEALYETLEQAAQAYGCGAASLNVMLSRGGGECSRKQPWQGNPTRITCKREYVYAD